MENDSDANILDRIVVQLRECAQFLPPEQSKGVMIAIDVIERQIEMRHSKQFS